MTTIDMTNPTTRNLVILHTVTSALAIELGTGLKASRGRSPMQVLRADFGFTGRSKKDALRFAVDQILELDPTYTVRNYIRELL